MACRATATLSYDLELVLAAADPRPDALETVVEAEWIERHLGCALRALRRDLDERSFDVILRLLAGEPVAAVAARAGLSEQAVHKVKQRSTRRLAAIVAWSIAIEGHTRKPQPGSACAPPRR